MDDERLNYLMMIATKEEETIATLNNYMKLWIDASLLDAFAK